MTIKSFFFLIIFLISSSSYADSTKKNHNVVIVVDGVVLSRTNISAVKIEYYDNFGLKHEVPVNYIPGQLTIDEEDEIIISNSGNKDLVLVFNASEFCKGKTLTKRFEINLSYSVISNPYIVLNVYTMKKNKKIFFPLEGKDYTFEYDIANQPSLKRATKKDRNCKC